MIEINKNPTPRELRQFGLLWIVFFALIAGWRWYTGGSLETSLWIWGVAVAVAALGFAILPFMRLVFLGMTYLAFPIGWTVSHIVMALVFFLVLTPIGLIMRLGGRDSLQRRYDRNADSYWHPLPPENDSKRYFRQF